VFEVPAGEVSQTVKGHEKLLTGDADLEDKIREAVESCPVEVIEAEEG
jgi:ferredoxin